MSLEKETVGYVANLARIHLTDKELDKFFVQLQNIIDFIDKLKKIDTKEIEPMTHAMPISNVFRQDIPQSSLSEDKVFLNAPLKKGNFFVVPKVIE